jgi:hypothetical protein
MKKLIACWLIFSLCNVVHAQEPENTNINDKISTTYAGLSNKVNQDNSSMQDDPGRTKTISKSFQADRSDKISLSNQFGPMVIKVWDKKEVKIDVSIMAYSDGDNSTQRLIDRVNIQADKIGDQISCTTVIDQDKKWSGRNRKREIRVNYVVYLPAVNALSISQKFGNVSLGDYAGPLSAKVQYGDLVTGNLTDDNNYISVQYGKTNIGAVNKATIKQQYGSGLTIGSVGELNLTAQYAEVSISTIKGDAVIKQQYGAGLKIGTVNNLTLDVQYANVNVTTVRGNAIIKQQYNSLELGSVKELTLKAQYTGVQIGNLRGDGNIRASYNNFNVTKVGTGCRNLAIDADYTDINLGFADSYNSDFSIQKTYGGFKYGPNVKASIAANGDDRHSSTKSYSGKIGNGGNGMINIKSDYGSVVFK